MTDAPRSETELTIVLRIDGVECAIGKVNAGQRHDLQRAIIRTRNDLEQRVGTDHKFVHVLTQLLADSWPLVTSTEHTAPSGIDFARFDELLVLLQPFIQAALLLADTGDIAALETAIKAVKVDPLTPHSPD